MNSIQSLQFLDWAIILIYFLLIAFVSYWSNKNRKESAEDYFLAGRHLGWFVVGTSIFASNIGSEHLVGLAGSGATDGVALAHYELHAWCLLVLGWVMVPFYMRSKVFTMPEFLEKRFTPNARVVLSLISLTGYVLTKISVGIFAGGIVFGVLIPDVDFMGMNSFWLGSVLVILLTGLYTAIGGLRAVAYTEAIQTVVLILGSILVTWFGLEALGGWDELRAICSNEMFSLWRPIVPEGVSSSWRPIREASQMAWYFNDNYPWPGMLFCAPIIGLWYWCTDQYIVQRTLGARDIKQGRRGSIFAALLKLLPVFIFIIPGMICYALAKSGQSSAIQGVLFNTQGELIRENAQQAFPLLVVNVLPIGVRGLVVAGLLAALMSSLAGVFNASSTLFTMDFYQRFRPEATQQRLVWVGRAATATMVLIGLLWVPVIQGGKGMYDYLQGVSAYLGPPIFVVFFAGIFAKRLNGTGCMATLIIGFAMGLFRLAVDTPVKLIDNFSYPEGTFLWIINNIYFQYYSLLITIVSTIVLVVVSYLTMAPDYNKISGLTYATMSNSDRVEVAGSWSAKDVVFSLLVLVLIAMVYFYFR